VSELDFGDSEDGSNEVIERGARALHTSGVFPSLIPWERCAEIYRRDRRMQARAVIESIREPTEAMKSAGAEGGEPAGWCGSIWKRMIDEMLR